MIRLFLLALAYFTTGWLGLQIPYAGTHITLIWLPTGVAVAALLRWDRSVWPGIFIGSILVNLSIGSPWLLATGIAVGNTFAPMLTVEWLKRVGFFSTFERKKDIGIFVLSAGFGMTVSASCGVLNLYLAGFLPVQLIGSAWLSWWMGDSVGVLLAGPILLTISKINVEKLVTERSELLIWLLVAIPIGWIAFLFNYEDSSHPLPLALLTLPLFVWAALRFGITGSGLAGLGFALLASWGTATQRGIFFLPDAQISLFLLWTYVTATALTGLFIVTLQAENASRIRDSEEMFRALYEASSEAHMLLEPEAGFTGANLATARLFGCRDINEFLTLSPVTASPEFQPDGSRSDAKAKEMITLAMKNGAHSFEWVHQRMDKSTFFAEVLLTRIMIGGKNIIQATVRDITMRKNADEEISKLAFYDALTGLPNRRLLMDRLQHALASSARTGREGALMFIDLDHFKNLNDTLGHDMGDVLLQQVAVRLSICVREVDTVARLGGDEFVVMLCNLSDNMGEAATQAEKVGVKILTALNKNYVLAGNSHRNTPSIGVTLFTDCKDNMSELLKRADLAMYQAKASGRNSLQFFDTKIQQIVNAHVALENEIRQGLFFGEFVLHYQPQIDNNDQVTGVEALVRWNHPTRGLAPPVEFISLAEETGLIIPLGQWVLKAACEQLVVWAAQPSRSHLTMAVNVSAIQFRSANYVDQVLAALDQTGANPKNLKLEITESTLMEDVDGIIERMLALKSRGINFSLDDFGTGYSSLSYLKRLPLTQLKIDQSFVRDVLTDPNDATFTRVIISLGQSLGLSVIAEGVENEEQRQFLLAHHCFEYQGYLFSRAIPINEFEEFMDSKSALNTSVLNTSVLKTSALNASALKIS